MCVWAKQGNICMYVCMYVYIYMGKYPNIDYRIEINLGFGASSRIEKKRCTLIFRGGLGIEFRHILCTRTYLYLHNIHINMCTNTHSLYNMMQSASIIKYTQASLELETQASQTLPDPKQQTHSP